MRSLETIYDIDNDASSEFEATCGCTDQQPAWVFDAYGTDYMIVRVLWGRGFQVRGRSAIQTERKILSDYLNNPAMTKPARYWHLSRVQIEAVVAEIDDYYKDRESRAATNDQALPHTTISKESISQ